MRAAIVLLVACAGTAALPFPAAGQARDMGNATPIKVAVQVASVRLAGDTVILSYVVANRPKPVSGEDFWQLLVDTPAPAIRVDSPHVAQEWKTATQTRGEPTAVWTDFADDLVQPGQSSPELSYRAIGLPYFVRYWAVPDLFTHAPLGDDDSKPAARGGFKQYGDSGMTIGVVPPPTSATPADLVARVRRLVGYSCGPNQLITNSGICNSLRVKLTAASSAIAAGKTDAARGSIGAFQSELEAQRGKFVSETAYGILQPNVTYLLSRL